MIVLGIDTSCDDTSVGITDDFVVLANIISSQEELHAPWGGVVPNLAKRAHQKNFEVVYQQALATAKIKEEKIEVVAVTQGHGLAVALEVGIEKAKQLAKKLRLPLVAVHHSEGHFVANYARDLNNKSIQRDKDLNIDSTIFPALAVLIAGGQTQLIKVNRVGGYEIIGQTVDDAIGEAFDKSARVLGLGYPGGAALARAAIKGNDKAYSLPRPMSQIDNLDVSYAGLKTAFIRQVREVVGSELVSTVKSVESLAGHLTKKQITDLAAAFQAAAIDTLIIKIEKAIQKYGFKQIFFGGGVAVNQLLQSKMSEVTKKYQLETFFPTPDLCRDNAAMIAIAGSLRAKKGLVVSNFDQLDRQPQFSLSEYQ